MLATSCSVDLHDLVDYVVGLELPDMEIIEEHLVLRCSHCLTRLADLSSLLKSGVLTLDICLN